MSFVSSSGTAKQTYTYTDESPLVGINYYRLNQIDYNGKSSLSPTVTVSNNRKAYFSISPNPTNSHFTISANGVQRESPLSISLYNVFGQLVSQKQTVQNQIDMDMSGYPVGTYIVEINYKNEIQRSKIVKQ